MEPGEEYRIGNDNIYIAITCEPLGDDLVIVESTLRVGSEGRTKQSLHSKTVTEAQVQGEVDLHIGMAWCWFDKNKIELAHHARLRSVDQVEGLLASARAISNHAKQRPQISV